jgi:hypothetical protein
MKRNIILIGIVALLMGCLLFFIAKADYSINVLQREDPTSKRSFKLGRYLQAASLDSLAQAFPYAVYLDSAQYGNVHFIQEDLALLDSIAKDPSVSRQLLSELLTNRLFARDSAKLATYNPDSLLALLQWAEKFKYYAEADLSNAILYKSICSYWLSHICNRLSAYSRENPSGKYAFKYKYLVARCHELKFTTAVKVGSMEKVVDNLTGNNWAHLVNASWNQTTILQKIVFLLITLISIYGYYLIIKKIIKR